jgi:hypothetical protein
LWQKAHAAAVGPTPLSFWLLTFSIAPQGVIMSTFESCLDLAKTQVALRALRYGHFPADIFDEYAWDMMLHMYIAALRNQPIYIDNVINLTSKNKFVGDRWIGHLVSEKMVTLEADLVALTEVAMQRMHTYHEEALKAVQ